MRFVYNTADDSSSFNSTPISDTHFDDNNDFLPSPKSPLSSIVRDIEELSEEFGNIFLRNSFDEEEEELDAVSILQFIKNPRKNPKNFARPIQLAALSSRFSTISEMVDFYASEKERLILESEEDIRRLSEENEIKLHKLREEELFEERIRVAQSCKAIQPACKSVDVDSLKEKDISIYSRNLFPHRRNGGGKKKSFKIPDAEVIKSRRSERRREKKIVKKTEEAERALHFAKVSSTSVVEEKNMEEEKSSVHDDVGLSICTEKELDTIFVHSEKQNVYSDGGFEINDDQCWNEDEEEDQGEIVDEEDHNKEVVDVVDEDEDVGDVEDDVNEEVEDFVNEEEDEDDEEEEKRKNIYQESFIEKKEIEVILDTLVDKKKVRDLLSKTKFCRTVAAGKECLYGDTCTFAHSLQELKQGECIFGDKCKFISLVSNSNSGEIKVVNNQAFSKICEMHHPSETKEECFQRIGFVPPQPIPPQQTPQQTPQQVTSTSNTIILQVPVELAMTAMISALNSGNTDIKLVIDRSQMSFSTIKISKDIIYSALPSLINAQKNIHIKLF